MKPTVSIIIPVYNGEKYHPYDMQPGQADKQRSCGCGKNEGGIS